MYNNSLPILYFFLKFLLLRITVFCWMIILNVNGLTMGNSISMSWDKALAC